MANTQIKLRQLIQDGATTKQVIAWDGSNWAPSAVAGGIYSGSGTIASGAVATVFTNSSFSIKYNATATALSIVENTGALNLYDGTTTARVLLDDLKARMSYSEFNLTIDSARATLNTDLKLTSGYLSLDSAVTPSAITADTNDYNPANLETSSILRISATGTFTITGLSSSHIAAAESGRLLVITNVGSNTINLHNESSSSAAANRFSFGSNVLLEPNKSITLYYDNTSDRWRPTSILHQGGGAGIDGSGTAGTIAKFTDADTIADSYLSENTTTKVVTINTTGALIIPVGNDTTELPASPAQGMVRYDNVNHALEYYNSNGTTWEVPLKSGTSNGLITSGRVLISDSNSRANSNGDFVFDSSAVRLSFGTSSFIDNTKVLIDENFTALQSTGLRVRGVGSSTSAWKGRIVAGGENVAFLMGEYKSQAWLGAHNAALNAWAPFYINPDGNENLYLGREQLITVKNSGKVVGVGVTSPTSNFEVGQASAGPGTVSTTASSTTLTGTNTVFTNTFKVGDVILVSGETTRTITSIASNTQLTVSVAFSTTQTNVSYTVTSNTTLSVKGYGDVGIGTTTPTALLHVKETTTITSGAQTTQIISLGSSSTPIASFGPRLVFQAKSSTTEDQDVAAITATWATATHSSRQGVLTIFGANTALERVAQFVPGGANGYMNIGTSGTTFYYNSTISPGTTFTIGGTGNTVQLGTSGTTQPIVLITNNSSSAAIRLDAVNNGGMVQIGGTNYSGTPTAKVDMQFTTGYASTSGTGTYAAIRIANTIDVLGTGTTRGLFVDTIFGANGPSTTGLYRAVDIAPNHARVWGVYQSGALCQNSFVGKTVFGSTSTPNASTIIDLVGTTAGLGLPAMTTTNMNAISSPRAGLMVYDSTVNKVAVRNASAWTYLRPETSVINTQTASYTLVIGDGGNIVTINVSTANTLTVPANSSVAFPIGTTIDIVQLGAGQVSVSPAAGVTLNSADNKRKLRVAYSSGTLIKTGTDSWVLVGDIAT